MGRAAALGPCSGGPSRLPKSLGLAERSALSRPPPRAAGMARLSSGGPRAAQARAESRGSPTVDALICCGPLCEHSIGDSKDDEVVANDHVTTSNTIDVSFKYLDSTWSIFMKH